MIVDVAFTHGPPRPLSYEVPADMDEAARPGSRVIVSLRSRKCIGVIWRRVESCNDRQCKQIHEVIDLEPVLSAEQIQFAEWMSNYYYSPLPPVLRLFLPSFLMEPDNLLIQRVSHDSQEPAGREDEILERIQAGRPIKVSTLRKKLGTTRAFYSRLAELEKSGRVIVSFKRSTCRKAERRLVSLVASVEDTARLGLKQKLLVYHLENLGKPVDMAVLTAKVGISKRSIESLAEKGVISIERSKEGARAAVSVQELMLNKEQADVTSSVSEAIGKRKFEVFLLYGVTGSGKTEVYVKLIWEALETGRTALLLQPEIALSEQIFSKLSSRFGDRVCRLHSDVGVSERYAIFRGVRSGRISVVIGPRSAMFSPLKNVGLVIVDEEHDHSYKQGGKSPLYQGRDSAVMWGKINGCAVVLGSATPSVESWGNAADGKYTLLKLTRRWDERNLPEVKVIVHKPGRDEELLSDHLAARIAENVAEGAQTVLFLNRRGFAPAVKCLDCRTSLRCPNCDVGLVYHLSRKCVMCHLCGYMSDLVAECPTCHGLNWGYFGFGTQRIEDYLNRRFPSARIGRLDLDAIDKVGSAGRLLSRFSTGRIDVLVGTQMVAKGLDFPGVKLVGILGADASMNLPDFRAVERTYALVFQAAGRAGRGRYAGEVVIQVDDENSPLARNWSENEFGDFLDLEYRRRTELNYPPRRHLIMVRMKSASAERVERAAFDLQKMLAERRSRYERFMEVLGPAPAPLFRVRNNYRWRILIKALSVSSSLAFMDGFLGEDDTRRILKGVRIIIDVDPYDMM